MNNLDIVTADQINLDGFKGFIKTVLRGFFRVLAFLGLVLIRQKKIILSCWVAGISLGVIYHFIVPKQYKASMIVVSYVFPKKAYAQIINQLNLMTHSGPPGILADELLLPDRFRTDLKYIDSKTINDEDLVSDTSAQLGQPFQIIVGLSKIEGTDTVQAAILNYINTLPYMKRLSDIENGSNREKLVTIQKDLEKLDTLKTEFNHYFATSKMSATINNVVVNPADIYVQSHILENERSRTVRALYMEDKSLALVAGLKGSRAPLFLKSKQLLMLVGAGGLLLGLILAFLLELKKLVL